MATIRELVIKFGFDVDEAPLKKLETSIEDLKAGFVAVAGAAAGAAAAIFGITKSTANAADAIHDTSIAVGVSQDQLQRLGYAAQLSGSSQEELADSLKFLARASYDARDAGSEAAKTFRRLGVSALDTHGKLKKPDEILFQLADAFKKMPSGVEKSTTAMTLFGRSGNKFVQVLDNGSAGLRELGDEAAGLGIIMDDAAIAAGTKFNDNLDSLIATIKGVIHVIGAGLLPVVSDIFMDMREWIKVNRELIKSRLQNFVQVLSKYLKELWRVVNAVYLVFKTLVTGIDKLTSSLGGFSTILKILGALIGLYFLGRMGSAIVGVAQGFYAIAKAAIVAWRSVLLVPILIGAAIAAVFLIIEDFVAYLDGRPSVLGFILKNKDAILAKIAAFLELVMDYVGKALRTLTIAFLEFFGIPRGEAEAAFDSIANALKKLVTFAMPYLLSFGAFLKETMGFAISGITLLLQGLATAFVALVTDPKQALSDFANYISEVFLGALLTIKDAFLKLGAVIYDSFTGIFSNLITYLGGLVVTVFSGVADMVIAVASSIGGKIKAAIIEPVTNAMAELGGFIKDKFGAFATTLGFDFPSPAPQAVNQIQSVITSPFAGVTPAATTSNMNNQANNTSLNSTINVTVPPGSDANEIGEAVRRAANEEFSKMLRPAARATKPSVQY